MHLAAAARPQVIEGCPDEEALEMRARPQVIEG